MTFIERLDAYRSGTITDHEMSVLWLDVTKFIQKTSRSHFKQPQRRGFKFKPGGVQRIGTNPLNGTVTDNDKYELYMTQMVRFFDFLSAYPERPAKWVLFVWRRRYAWIYQVIEAELLGVGIYPVDLPFHKRVTHNITKKLVECKLLLRKLNAKPTDYLKLWEPLNELHTERYAKETICIFAGYVRVAYAWLYPKDHELSGGV